MRFLNVRRAALTATAAATIMAGLASTAATATAAQPGDVCQIRGDREGWVFSAPVPRPTPDQYMYTIPPLAWFRVLGYSGIYYYGRGDGRANGYMQRDWIEQSTCHPT